MASNKFDLNKDGKASSLIPVPPSADVSNEHHKHYGTAVLNGRPAEKKSLFWVTDVIILLVIAALGTLAYLYLIRPLMENYHESWDEQKLVYVLELQEVDPALVTYDRDGVPMMCGHPVWSSEHEDGDKLGEVREAETIAIVREDGSTVLTVRLTVEADVRYRSGEGYRMGETALLCGEERVWRLYGLNAKGMIISMESEE